MTLDEVTQVPRMNPVDLVSRARSEALYVQVLGEIRRRISGGEWVAGQRVPSERDLAQLLGVSRITVRKAIDLAVQEGLLSQSRGVGTFVGAATSVQQDLSEVRTFERTITDQGMTASTELDFSGIVPADISMSRTLHLDALSGVYNLRLVGLGDAVPVVYYDSYFPQGLGQKMASAADDLISAKVPFSTLDLYKAEGIGRVPNKVVQTIGAVPAGDSLARILHLSEGAPVLVIESLMVDDLGTLEFRRAHYRPDRYKFTISRRVGALLAP